LDFTVATSNPRAWTVEIDNTLNAYPVYLKMWWDSAASVTPGATACNLQLVAPASTKQTYTFSSGPTMMDNGASQEICWSCQDAPGTPEGSAPVAPVAVRLLYCE
jgi:hypothetical protein